MTATSSPWPQSQGSRFAWSPARIDHAVHATCTGRDAVSARSPRENAGSSRTRTNPPQGRRPANSGAADAERTHPPLRAPPQAERARLAVLLLLVVRQVRQTIVGRSLLQASPLGEPIHQFV